MKVAFSKKIKKRYLRPKRPKRPLIFWTKRLPKSLKVLYFFGVCLDRQTVRLAQSELQNDTWRRRREGDERWLTNPRPETADHDAPEPRKKGSGFDWRCFTFTFWSSFKWFFWELFFRWEVFVTFFWNRKGKRVLVLRETTCMHLIGVFLLNYSCSSGQIIWSFRTFWGLSLWDLMCSPFPSPKIPWTDPCWCIAWLVVLI